MPDSMIWLKYLNAFGIILNLLAGFMLAPELIGAKRLRQTEKQLQKLTLAMKKSLSVAMEKLNAIALSNWLRINKDDCLSYLVLGIIALLFLVLELFFPALRNWRGYLREAYYYVFNPVYAATSTGTPVLFSALPYYLAATWVMGLWYFLIRVFRILTGRARIREIPSAIFTTIMMPFVIALAITVGWAVLLASLAIRLGLLATWLLAVVFQIRLSRFLTKLENGERLPSLLVWWGVVFFILGNLFQFIAAIM